jgi:hypothetical protein
LTRRTCNCSFLIVSRTMSTASVQFGRTSRSGPGLASGVDDMTRSILVELTIT